MAYNVRQDGGVQKLICGLSPSRQDRISECIRNNKLTGKESIATRQLLCRVAFLNCTHLTQKVAAIDSFDPWPGQLAFSLLERYFFPVSGPLTRTLGHTLGASSSTLLYAGDKQKKASLSILNIDQICTDVMTLGKNHGKHFAKEVSEELKKQLIEIVLGVLLKLEETYLTNLPAVRDELTKLFAAQGIVIHFFNALHFIVTPVVTGASNAYTNYRYRKVFSALQSLADTRFSLDKAFTIILRTFLYELPLGLEGQSTHILETDDFYVIKSALFYCYSKNKNWSSDEFLHASKNPDYSHQRKRVVDGLFKRIKSGSSLKRRNVSYTRTSAKPGSKLVPSVAPARSEYPASLRGDNSTQKGTCVLSKDSPKYPSTPTTANRHVPLASGVAHAIAPSVKKKTTNTQIYVKALKNILRQYIVLLKTSLTPWDYRRLKGQNAAVELALALIPGQYTPEGFQELMDESQLEVTKGLQGKDMKVCDELDFPEASFPVYDQHRRLVEGMISSLGTSQSSENRVVALAKLTLRNHLSHLYPSKSLFHIRSEQIIYKLALILYQQHRITLYSVGSQNYWPAMAEDHDTLFLSDDIQTAETNIKKIMSEFFPGIWELSTKRPSHSVVWKSLCYQSYEPENKDLDISIYCKKEYKSIQGAMGKRYFNINSIACNILTGWTYIPADANEFLKLNTIEIMSDLPTPMDIPTQTYCFKSLYKACELLKQGWTLGERIQKYYFEQYHESDAHEIVLWPCFNAVDRANSWQRIKLMWQLLTEAISDISTVTDVTFQTLNNEDFDLLRDETIKLTPYFPHFLHRTYTILLFHCAVSEMSGDNIKTFISHRKFGFNTEQINDLTAAYSHILSARGSPEIEYFRNRSFSFGDVRACFNCIKLFDSRKVQQ